MLYFVVSRGIVESVHQSHTVAKAYAEGGLKDGLFQEYDIYLVDGHSVDAGRVSTPENDPHDNG